MSVWQNCAFYILSTVVQSEFMPHILFEEFAFSRHGVMAYGSVGQGSGVVGFLLPVCP